MKKLIRQIIKFGIVGTICFLIDYALLYLCTEYLGMHYLISGICSFTVSVVVNYYLSSRFVFVMKIKNIKEEFFLFVLLSVVGLGINEVILGILTETFSVYYMFSKIVATAIVMVYNFVTRKVLIERTTSSAIRRNKNRR